MDTNKNQDPSTARLSELARHWRNRADISTYPGLAQEGRRRAGLTQEEVAKLADTSSRWIGALEQGKKANFSAGVLDGYASALRLRHDERRLLYSLTVGRLPALAPAPEAELRAEMDEGLQRLLDSLCHAALVTDLAWNVIGYNKPLLDWFPWAAHQANYMQWTFLDPVARQQLVDWEERWARPALRQIRFELDVHGNCDALQRLKRKILDGSPEARRIWKEGPTVLDRVDGDLRGLRLPCHDGRDITVRVMALRPMRHDELRMMLLMKEP